MQVKIGNVVIGNGKIAVQSMTDTKTNNIEATAAQIQKLENEGCDIVRVAVRGIEDASAIKELKRRTNMPIVADIHFDYRLAILSIESGADKVRVNPGNLGLQKLGEVARAAQSYGVAMRIGANGGSVKENPDEAVPIISERGMSDSITGLSNRVNLMVDSLEPYINECVRIGFNDLVLAAKSSNVLETIEANRRIKHYGYPIHLGVTEAGVIQCGLIKSAIGIGALLLEGIGDTIRVSLTADPVEEVRAAYEILRSVGKYDGGVEVISCPKCGRCEIDLALYAQQIYDATRAIKIPLKVSVMGCAVNGVGEAKHADIGLAGGNGEAVIFRNGAVVKKVLKEDAVRALLLEIYGIANA